MKNRLFNLKKTVRPILVAIALIPFLITPAHAAENKSIVAIFLFNFANFIEWPRSAFQKTQNLEICLIGDISFINIMRKFEGTPVRNRPIRVIATQDETIIEGGCHILYVGINRREDIKKFLKNLNHMFVLSVGESQGFLSDGGTINIVRIRDQASFSIDLNKATRNGLLVNSDLLELATVINEN